MMAAPDEFTGPVNLGNPDEFSILKLAEIIVHLVGSKSPIVFKTLPHDDPMRRQPDITLAKNKMKWEPRISLEDGLAGTIEYFKEFA